MELTETVYFDSSAVEYGEYNLSTGSLTLAIKGKTRKDGSIGPTKFYTYANVPGQLWDDMVNSVETGESVGHMWIYDVIPNYELQPV